MKPPGDDVQQPRVSIEMPPNHQSQKDQETGSADVTTTNGDGIIISIKRVLAEAVGTFIIVFGICAILSSLERMGVGGGGGLMGYAATAATTVIVIVYGMGEISGAHANPAVTIAFATVGPFPWIMVPFYVLAQVGGSVSGSIAGRLIYKTKMDLLITKPLQQGWAPAFSVEFIATSIVVFLAASFSSDPQSHGAVAGFVVGAAIGLGVIITGPVSGGSMNPARSIGPAIVKGDYDQLWIYVVAPILGAIFGAMLYRALRLQGWACCNHHHHQS